MTEMGLKTAYKFILSMGKIFAPHPIHDKSVIRSFSLLWKMLSSVLFPKVIFFTGFKMTNITATEP